VLEHLCSIAERIRRNSDSLLNRKDHRIVWTLIHWCFKDRTTAATRFSVAALCRQIETEFINIHIIKLLMSKEELRSFFLCLTVFRGVPLLIPARELFVRDHFVI
jgi:hypothetical protein